MENGDVVDGLFFKFPSGMSFIPHLKNALAI